MSMRFHTDITDRGRRYRDTTTSRIRTSAIATATMLVSTVASKEPTLSPPPVGPPPTSTPPIRLTFGVEGVVVPESSPLGSQPLSRRQGWVPVRPRWIGVYWTSAVRSAGIHPYGCALPSGDGK